MVLDGLGYLAALDPTSLAAEAQAKCLQALEQRDAISTAARARILAAFTAGQGYSADGDYSPTSWLIHRTKVTKGTARGHVGWARLGPPWMPRHLMCCRRRPAHFRWRTTWEVICGSSTAAPMWSARGRPDGPGSRRARWPVGCGCGCGCR